MADGNIRFTRGSAASSDDPADIFQSFYGTGNFEPTTHVRYSNNSADDIFQQFFGAASADQAKPRRNPASSADPDEIFQSYFRTANFGPTTHAHNSNRSADERFQPIFRPVSAEQAKAKGNAAYAAGQFEEAVQFFSQAINLTPTNHVLYSNRSAAYVSLHQYPKALADAKKTIRLEPEWPKGYSRLGTAHVGLGNFGEAIAAYKKGLQLDPNNEGLKSGLADARAAAARSRASPSSPTEEKVNVEEKEARERKARAQEEKEAGDLAFKKKYFETAIEHYTKALELDDEDISILNNRAAVYSEMGKSDKCIKDCDEAVEKGRELRSKVLTQKGSALVKMAKCAKDYVPAIETFLKALTEHHNPDTLRKLNDAEIAKKELEKQEYFDLRLADDEREKGNECFKQQKYQEAVKHYTEALRGNPKDPRVYSNRAACYTKLGALPKGLKDAEKCIELNPSFSKGYTRKGAIQFFMKEYDEALETYLEGLRLDPNNEELMDGVRRCSSTSRKTVRQHRNT